MGHVPLKSVLTCFTDLNQPIEPLFTYKIFSFFVGYQNLLRNIIPSDHRTKSLTALALL